MLYQRMGGQTRTQDGSDIILGPVRHLNQGFPDRFPIQCGSDYIRARDNQRIQALLDQGIELKIVSSDMLFGISTAIEFAY